MHEDSDKERHFLQEEFSFLFETGRRLVSQRLVIEIEARERLLETEGDSCSEAAAGAYIAVARRQ